MSLGPVQDDGAQPPAPADVDDAATPPSARRRASRWHPEGHTPPAADATPKNVNRSHQAPQHTPTQPSQQHRHQQSQLPAVNGGDEPPLPPLPPDDHPNAVMRAAAGNSGAQQASQLTSGSHLASQPAACWTGQLAKGGIFYCHARTLEHAPAEPLLWPALLDVGGRDMKGVPTKGGVVPYDKGVEAAAHLALRNRIIAWPRPEDPHTFDEYVHGMLAHKHCGYLKDVPMGGRVGKIFLLPGTAALYQQFCLQDPGQACLIAFWRVNPGH